LEEVLKILNPMTSTFFWTIIVFVLLMLALLKFIFKPVNSILTKRRDEIREKIDDAEIQKEEAAKYLEEQKKLLDEAKLEAKKIVEEGRITAVKIKEDIELQAHNRAQSMIHSAMEEIGSERERSLKEVKDKMIDIALLASEKVIAKSLSEDEHKKLIEDTLKEMERSG